MVLEPGLFVTRALLPWSACLGQPHGATSAHCRCGVLRARCIWEPFFCLRRELFVCLVLMPPTILMVVQCVWVMEDSMVSHYDATSLNRTCTHVRWCA
jgi:hypothetical protein